MLIIREIKSIVGSNNIFKNMSNFKLFMMKRQPPELSALIKLY